MIVPFREEHCQPERRIGEIPSARHGAKKMRRVLETRRECQAGGIGMFVYFTPDAVNPALESQATL
jgi:hypothetical protein